MVSRISLTPNRPITATRKLTPRSSSVEAEGHAQLAGDRIHADAGEQQSERKRDDGLVLVLAAQPDERAEGQQIDREEFRRPEAQREGRDTGREEGDQQHGKQRADEGGSEGSGQRLGGLPLLRHRIAVEGGSHRPGFAGNIEQDRRDRAAEQRAPIDAGQHHDGGGRIHGEGQRQQDGDAVRPAQARQHADKNAEHEADHHQREHLPGEKNPKPWSRRPKASMSLPSGRRPLPAALSA